jgi:hypothetical protein
MHKRLPPFPTVCGCACLENNVLHFPAAQSLARCSPRTQAIDSETLDLPQPFGTDDRRNAAAGENDFRVIGE